jgi:signal transduction histidine kinase/ligand-binding sensor domain-containing protein/DNA-binding response OmpR family regulator
MSATEANYYFRHINTENGLSQNTVLSILQDKNGFMWFGTKDGLNRYDGNTIKIFKQEENNPASIGNNTVWSLLELPGGVIWAGTEKGIYIYDMLTNSFKPFNATLPDGSTVSMVVMDMKFDGVDFVYIATLDLYRYSLSSGKLEKINYLSGKINDEVHSPLAPKTINIDNNGQVWIGDFLHGLQCYNPKENLVKSYLQGDSTPYFVSKTINLNNNSLLIGSINNQLTLLDKITDKIQPYFLSNGIDNRLYVRCMETVTDGNCWIGTESGLYIHNPISQKTLYLYHNINDRYSLSDNAIYSLYEDNEGGIWIGTYFGGVNYYPRPYAYFEMYYPVPGQNSIMGERISGICGDDEGNIWIGTEDAGLNRWNAKTKQFEFFPKGHGLNYHNVHDVILDGDWLWIATFSHGVNVYNLKTGVWKHYMRGEVKLDNNDIFAIFKDSAGRIWIGTSTSAFLYDLQKDNFIEMDFAAQHFISDILEDGAGKIWFSSYDNGVYCYDPLTGECKNYPYDPQNPASISYHKIISMSLDSKKRMWFASESKGICVFDEKTQQFTRYGENDGFANGVIYKILEDDSGNLWLSSNVGLMRFNPENKNIRIFTQNNGLPCNQFNYKSGYKDKSGKMYFGTVKGLVTFHPSKFIFNEHIPQVVITNFYILNKEGAESTQTNAKSIVLKHNQSSFCIDFAAMSFVAPEMNRYAYKMEGMESAWNFLNSAERITYSNLPAGKYIFRVKASNNDHVWNEDGDSVYITILPPFQQSKWAYFLYVALLIFFIFYILHYYMQKIKAKNERKQILFENQKEKEIYNAKIEFFTTIAHEIRTPLTLIKGPLENILKKTIDKDDLNENLRVMEKNTNRLHALINQLLDFRKTESKGFRLSFIKININDLLEETCSRFKPSAMQKQLDFSFQVTPEPIWADVDKEALIKIVSNLFTNAIKYSASFVKVVLNEAENHIFIRVENDGKKIPKELQEKIFEPFFQIKEESEDVQSGSGIGLALVKSLVELHYGKVYLEDSQQITDNVFVVVLPKTQKNVIDLKTEQADVSDYHDFSTDNEEKQTGNMSTILVVEDSEEMSRFITNNLKKQYRILIAQNGREAIEILNQQIVNLIISDIMMPQMTGLEFCEKIKKNQEYSHIPVILLTAMVSIQNKISGLESGADAYIEKPFSPDYLHAQISNLLDNRRKLWEVFATSPFIHTKSIATNKSDEQFLNKLTGIIHRNIENTDFNVDKLAEDLCMSRSSLLRKIKGISEIMPNDFIRIIRLKRAAEMLKEGKYKVNEVCYMVGFQSNSHFTKAFYKQFGILPKDFVKVP